MHLKVYYFYSPHSNLLVKSANLHIKSLNIIGMDDPRVVVLRVLAAAFSSSSFCCSGLNLVLMYFLKKKSGVVTILTHMAIHQMIYDASFYPSIFPNSSAIADHLWSIVQIYSGLVVTLWTNCLATIVFSIVVRRKPIGVFDRMPLYMIVSYGPTVVLVVFGIITWAVNYRYGFDVFIEIYYWTRLGSIIYNFIFFGLCKLSVRLRKRTASVDSKVEKSIGILAERLMYYPLVQFLCRLCAAVYERLYPQYSIEMNNRNDSKFVLGMLFVSLNPAAGIGFFIIFLLFHPDASRLLYSIFCQCTTSINSENSVKNTDSFSDIRNSRRIDAVSYTSNSIHNFTSGSRSSETDTIIMEEDLNLMGDEQLIQLIEEQNPLRFSNTSDTL
jgi:hypothetical protein